MEAPAPLLPTRFDDRLDTALRQRVGGLAAAQIQYSQLLDLLGTTPAEARGPLLDAAYARLAELSRIIPAADRAAMLAQGEVRLRSPRLVAALAAHEPQVAQAAMRAARLSEDQWLDLIPALSPAARMAMADCPSPGPRARTLLARLGVTSRALPFAPPPVAQAAAAPETGAAVAEPEPASTPAPAASATPAAQPLWPATPAPLQQIGALVERIEAFRRARQAAPPSPANDAPRLPLGEDQPPSTPVRSFDFITDTNGRITWADATVAPMMVGRNLAAAPELAATLRRRLPLRGAGLALDGAALVAGAWRVDAVARFEAGSGRFTGYHGRMRRPAEAPRPANDEATQLRQVLHELRTPINAVQGFAEIIQQQLFGATPHHYRALAANIAADAAQILGGFDELERLARLESGALALPVGSCDFAATLHQTLGRLGNGGNAMALRATAEPLPVALPEDEAERLCWRLVGTLLAQNAGAAPLPATLGRDGDWVCLTITLPAALATLDDAALLQAEADEATRGPNLFGTGFALRLVAAEARAAGGHLVRRKELLNLFLPIMPQAHGNHIEGQAGEISGSAYAAAIDRG
jgi:hypothetical protein